MAVLPLSDMVINGYVHVLNSTEDSHYVMPSDGFLIEVGVAVNNDPGAETDLVIRDGAGGTAIATLVVPNGSSSGDVISDDTINHFVSKGDVIEIDNEGAGNNAARGFSYFILRRQTAG